MKKTRLIVCGLLLTVFLLLVGFSGIKTNAANLTTDANLTVEGASVRTTDPLGLRFVAKTGEFDKTKATAYGIVLAFGEVADLNELVINGKVNGKTVANGEVAELNEFGTFAVTLIGEVDVNPLPEALYAQKITARAYAKTADGVVYGATATTRSLLECTLAAKNDGNTSEVLANVLKYVDDNYVLVANNYKGNVEVKADFKEDSYKNLKPEFLKDWNKLFNTNLTKMDNEFHKNASAGAELECIFNTNLYKFFNDEKMKTKWGWLLDFFLTCPDKAVHPVRQINALKSATGTAEDSYGKTMNNLRHLDYSFINFFNNTAINDGMVPIYFGDVEKYARVKEFTNVYVNINNYELRKVGDTLALDKAVANNGYEFKGYTANGVAIEGLNYTLENKTVELLPVYEAINYTISYELNGGTTTATLVEKYNIESDEIKLPELSTMSKPNQLFAGWYDNSLFEGEAITKLNANSTGNKTYYAKWVDEAPTKLEVSAEDLSALNKLNATPNIIINPRFVGGKFEVNNVVYTCGVNAFSSLNIAFANGKVNNNDLIYIFAGSYSDDITIDKPCTIAGVNYGTAGNGTRTTESILNANINVTASNVTMDGIKLAGATQTRFVGKLANITIKNTFISQTGKYLTDYRDAALCNVSGEEINKFTFVNNKVDVIGGHHKSLLIFNGKIIDLEFNDNDITNSGNVGGSSECMTIGRTGGVYNIKRNNIVWSGTNFTFQFAVNSSACTEMNIIDNVIAGKKESASGLALKGMDPNTSINLIGNKFINVSGNIFNFERSGVGSITNIWYNLFDAKTAYKLTTPGNTVPSYKDNCYLCSQTTATSDYGKIKTEQALEEAYNQYKNSLN